MKKHNDTELVKINKKNRIIDHPVSMFFFVLNLRSRKLLDVLYSRVCKCIVWVLSYLLTSLPFPLDARGEASRIAC